RAGLDEDFGVELVVRGIPSVVDDHRPDVQLDQADAVTGQVELPATEQGNDVVEVPPELDVEFPPSVDAGQLLRVRDDDLGRTGQARVVLDPIFELELDEARRLALEEDRYVDDGRRDDRFADDGLYHFGNGEADLAGGAVRTLHFHLVRMPVGRPEFRPEEVAVGAVAELQEGVLPGVRLTGGFVDGGNRGVDGIRAGGLKPLLDREYADLLRVGFRIERTVERKGIVGAEHGYYVFLAAREAEGEEQCREQETEETSHRVLQRIQSNAILRPKDGTRGSWSARWSVKTSR